MQLCLIFWNSAHYCIFKISYRIFKETDETEQSFLHDTYSTANYVCDILQLEILILEIVLSWLFQRFCHLYC